MPRIELTNEIVKAITMNCPIACDTSKCFAQCALAGACLEYWTGNARYNQDQEESKNV